MTVARISAAAVLAQLITLMLLETSTYWPILTVLILSAKNVGVTWTRAFQRGLGTVFGFSMAICLVAIFPQTPGALMFSFIPIFLISLYLSQTVATNSYAFFMVVITMTVVVSPAWSDPGMVVDSGLDRITETLIGIFCVSFVSRCVFPITAEHELEKSMQGSLDRADARFDLIVETLRQDSPCSSLDDSRILPESRTAFSEKIDLLNAAISESTRVQDQRGVWVARVNLTNRVAVQSEMLLMQLGKSELEKIPRSFRDQMVDAVLVIQSKWREIGTKLLGGQLPHVDRDEMEGIADKLESIRVHGPHAERVSAVTTTIMMLRQVGEVDNIMLYQDHVGDQSAHVRQGVIDLIRNRIHNRNIEALKLATKATLATMIALAWVATFRWFDAMLTMSVTTILVIQPTMGATWSKSLQRIIGAFIGCAFAIFAIAIVSANTNDVTWLLLAVAIGIGISAWLMSGSWETSYVGLQIGIAIALVMGTVQPMADVQPGIERVTGVLFGLCIVLTILRLLWPVWAGSQICQSMSSAARQMASYLEVGIKDPLEEQRLRPPGGWNYSILSSISHAYKYREEARYERGLARAHQAPGLNMGVRLQVLLPKIVLVVQARQLRSLREDIIFHPAATALRNGIENRLGLIADLAEGGDGSPEPLQPLLDRAYSAIGPDSDLPAGTDPRAVGEFLGYYGDMIPDLDSLVDDARQTASLFSEKRGISRLAMARFS